jgi:ABC-type transport system substrate-binding protein
MKRYAGIKLDTKKGTIKNGRKSYPVAGVISRTRASAAVLAEVWRILAEEQPYVFMYYPQQFVALSSDVRGFTHHPRFDMYKVNEWWLDR